jgi:hypothetical protein
MNELLIATQKASGITEELDPNYNLVSLHLRGDVNTGRDYNAFSDASSNNFRLTNNGEVRGSSFSPYGTSWSAYFDGSGDYLANTTTASTGFNLSTGAFTIEAWVYLSSVASYQYVLNFANAAGAASGLVFGINTSGQPYIGNGSVVGKSGSTALTVNTWTHIAVVSDGTNIQFYTNGQANGSAQAFNPNTAQYVYVGRDGTGGNQLTGYISNIRIVKGQALFTGAFNPSTLPVTASTVGHTGTGAVSTITGTVAFLACHANRFIDGGSSSLMLSAFDGARISSFSPFLDSDTTTGSAYFDGTSDYLDVTSALFNPAGAFTLEFWFYPTLSTSPEQGIISSWPSGLSPAQGILLFKNSAGVLEVALGNASTGYTAIGTGTWTNYMNQWNHLALVRNASNSCAVFVNGNRLASPVTKSGAPGQTTLTIGRYFPNNTGYNFQGNISNLHFVSGSSLYDPSLTNITVPTIPITKNASTALLTLQERGAYNTVGFQDESEYQHIITRTNNVAQGTFSPFSQAGWAVNFGGGSSNINLASSADFALGGAFSFECWVYQTSIPNFVDLLDVRTSNEVGSLGISATGFPRWQNGPSTGSLVTGSTALTLNQWNYLLFVADASGCSIYLNGQRIANTAQVATWPTSARPCFIGGSFGNASGGSLSGFIADARLIKGSTPYSSTATSVTVPTALLPFVTNTVLQCCRTNRFANTVNSASMTANGTTSITAFSPFKPPVYEAQTHGGSAYFDGAGDYLSSAYSIANTAFTGDFCLECFVYFNALPSTKSFGMKIASAGNGSNSGWYFQATTANVFNISTYGSGPSLTGTTVLTANQWYHVALVRSGANFSIFVNGTRDATTSSGSAAFANTAATALFLGTYSGDAGNSNHQFSGYIASCRIVNGFSVYDATQPSILIPSSPLPLINNTSLLLNFTNGGVIDSTGKNVIESMGNSGVVTTALKKYGTGSMFFDATADQQRVTPQAQPVLGNGDWTVEFWAYANATPAGGYCGRFVFSNAGFFIRNASGTVIDCGWSGSGAAITTASGVAAANTWQHIALAKSGNTVNLYVNGVCRGTTASWTWNEYTSEYFIVGSTYTGSEYFNGYIDDFRVTRGLARYTGSTVGTTYFTAPTKALPNRAVASTATTSLTAPTSVEALIVGGGGGAGGQQGGGGGAGGFREFMGGNAIAVSANNSYRITVGSSGSGGASGAGATSGTSGGSSIFSNVTSEGGGGGGTVSTSGLNGGSGGGGGHNSPGTSLGGLGNRVAGTTTVVPTQGNNGGDSNPNATNYYAGGGGGAGGVGQNGSPNNGNGGLAQTSSITGTSIYYAGGGGAGSRGGTAGLGGGTATTANKGGGGDGSASGIGLSALTNTGGGGGGGAYAYNGGNGGSGVVILAYPTTNKPLTASLGLVYTIDTVTRPGYRVYKFVAGTGTISW